MHTDARKLEDGTLIEGDLCIVGAGAAGISMALEWAGTSHDVILLEGGGFEVESQMQDLYGGEIVGQSYYPLDAARLHAFGGTTGHWAGYCARLDPIDFQKRDWVPGSGWPFGREELDPFYARAHELVELGPKEWGAGYWAQNIEGAAELPLSQEVARTKIWQFSPPTRFGREYRDEITGAENVHLYSYANAVEVEANEPVRVVDGLHVKTPNGKDHRAQATQYVLACGAIQNARLLLASTQQAPKGLGNENDLVGRYFMEHIEMPAAQLLLSETRPMKLYTEGGFGGTPRGELALTGAVQRRRRLLNGTASLEPGVFDELQGTFQRFSPQRLKKLWNLSNQELKALLKESAEKIKDQPPPSQRQTFKLYTRQGQAPNPNSRVTLTEETDAMNMPRVALDWQLSELDKQSMLGFFQTLGREMGRSGVGRVKILDWLRKDESSWPDFVSGAWHHMGTARMHEDPSQGVVDPNCKVHGLGNLYVAGSATFPTAGAANPTLTLLALTLRLSDHLKTKVG